MPICPRRTGRPTPRSYDDGPLRAVLAWRLLLIEHSCQATAKHVLVVDDDPEVLDFVSRRACKRVGTGDLPKSMDLASMPQSKRTLRPRIIRSHFGCNASGSTLRLTLGCLLAARAIASHWSYDRARPADPRRRAGARRDLRPVSVAPFGSFRLVAPRRWPAVLLRRQIHGPIVLLARC